MPLINHVVSVNLKRRHLTADQKAAIATDVLPYLEKDWRKCLAEKLTRRKLNAQPWELQTASSKRSWLRGSRFAGGPHGAGIVLFGGMFTVTLVSVIAYGSVLAALVVIFLALRFAWYLRRGEAWRFLWWIVAGAFVFAVMSIRHVLWSGELSPSEIYDMEADLVTSVFLALGLWQGFAFWKRKGR